MSEEVVLHEPQAPIGGNPAHVRLGINQIALVANYFADSGLFKMNEKVGGSFQSRAMTSHECFAIIMAGQALGIGPMPAMMSFHIIEGRPEMSANLQAHFLKASEKYDYRMRFVYADNGEVDACHVDVIDTRSGEVIGESRFTRAMAQKAGLIRERGNWMKYAESMLFARAISNAVAWHAPDAVPMRIYSDGEISGKQPDQGVQAVAGEGPVSTTRVEALVEQALASEPEEEIQDAEVVEDDPKGGNRSDFDPATEPPPPVVGPPTLEETRQFVQEMADDGLVRVEPDRFSPEAVETRLRQDLPNLSEADKLLIKAAVTSARPRLEWGYKAIVTLIVKAGYSDVNTWVSQLLRPGARQTTPAAASQTEPTPVGESLPEGVTGAKTGSQTAGVVSDAQVRMLHARMSACQFDEPEKRYFLEHFADAASTRDVKKADVDDLLAVLHDIETGDDATRRAYLGEAAN